MCTVASELGKFSKKTEVNMTLIGTKVINRKYDEITFYVNVGLFQNNGITCIKCFSVGQIIAHGYSHYCSI